jgi:hypothetical protein
MDAQENGCGVFGVVVMHFSLLDWEKYENTQVN